MLRSILYDTVEDELFIRITNQKKFGKLVFTHPDEKKVSYVGEAKGDSNVKKLSDEIYKVTAEPKIIFDVLLRDKYMYHYERSLKLNENMVNKIYSSLLKRDLICRNLIMSRFDKLKGTTNGIKFYLPCKFGGNPSINQLSPFLSDNKEVEKKNPSYFWDSLSEKRPETQEDISSSVEPSSHTSSIDNGFGFDLDYTRSVINQMRERQIEDARRREESRRIQRARANQALEEAMQEFTRSMRDRRSVIDPSGNTITITTGSSSRAAFNSVLNSTGSNVSWTTSALTTNLESGVDNND